MRQTLLALAMAGSIATIAAAQGQNGAAREGLVGPVKVVRAESVQAIRADGRLSVEVPLRETGAPSRASRSR